jgi:hypothetical protein
LQTLPTSDTGDKQEQLRRLEAILQANPTGQFQGAATAIGRAASASERVASARERAATALQLVGFDPQARALNATPIRQSNSSSVTNNNTVNIDGINVTGQTAVRVRELSRDINRETRRGVSRLA